MKICHVMPALFPVARYGGAERAAYYLAKGLAELGHENVFLCREGSVLPFAQTRVLKEDLALEAQIPEGVDIVQLYTTPRTTPGFPYLVCIQGNGKAGEVFLPNTVFLSKDHARRHGWNEYCFNGIDPSEYEFREKKEPGKLLFLAKARWGIKNLRGAIDIAEKARKSLVVCGGSGSVIEQWRFPHVDFKGMVGGEEKMLALTSSEALLFPVLWEEPFGVALIEALACGTPVIGSNWGSLPEIINSDCGALCETLDDYLNALSGLSSKKNLAQKCRLRVEEHFSHTKQAERYVEKYQRILSSGRLREGCPRCGDAFVQESVRSIEGTAMSLKMRWKMLRQSASRS